MRRTLLLLPLLLACETTDDRVDKDSPTGDVTIKPDEIEPMANFVLETRRILFADYVRIDLSSQFFEQQMGYTRDPELVARSAVEVLPDGTRKVMLKSLHEQTSNIDPDTLPRVYFGNSGLEIRARQIGIYLRPPKDRERPLFLTVDAKSDPGACKMWVSGRLQDERPRILIQSALLWSKDKESYVHKSSID
ncbi:MAG TPA: hypothetical protein VIC87_19140 [Vicinamibacteria bacterium]|jgi:hypothetical protein